MTHPISAEPYAQVTDAYRKMATEVLYRPAAPSDGLGNITVPLESLDLDAEADRYACKWWEQEDSEFVLGCAEYSLRPAMVFAVEAARMACGGDRDRMVRLLRMALDAAEGAQR